MIETRNIIWGKPHRDNVPKYSAEIDRYLKKDLRIWVIFSHFLEHERSSIIDFLKQKGKILRQFQNKGTLAYLFKINDEFSAETGLRNISFDKI
jgi:predicted DNA-binding protein YlxM (UPF0122 family)